MCGIYGFTVKKGADVRAETLREVLSSLVLLSESRGKEAAGVAIWDEASVSAYKEASPGAVVLKREAFRGLLDAKVSDARIAASPLAVIGHTRLVTNGGLETHANNQPVARGGIVGVHNGIIVNDAEIFAAHGLKREAEVDTEALLALLETHEAAGAGPCEALRRAYGELRGTANVALLYQDAPLLLLATNNGSLYRLETAFGWVFASEEYILQSVIARHGKAFGARTPVVVHFEPRTGLSVDLGTGTGTPFSLEAGPLPEARRDGASIPFHDIRSEEPAPPAPFRNVLSPDRVREFEKIYLANAARVDALKRCAKCILPSTMPFIAFDDTGICNYCRHHEMPKPAGPEALAEAVEKFRGKGDRPDCLFPLSGGRDSSYGLHYVTRVLKLRPIAYSYDWGMLTDLGRRNQARMCGKLGVEHLLVSADIPAKRLNIRKNVAAWLKKPDLGTVPLFMAGDKQYFWHLNKLRRRFGLDLTVYCENPLEQTNFKYGFCGVPPKFDRQHVYKIGLAKKLAMAFYYAKAAAANPGYINGSLLDTAGAYISTYFLPHDYTYLYDYLKWDEDEIDRTLIGEYDWELATDTKTSWRIGDGTAPFYNYIYYTAAGLTENDTFRSNQVREGAITRETALALAKRDNAPRFESMRWYFDTIGIDMTSAVEAIHAMPKRY